MRPLFFTGCLLLTIATAAQKVEEGYDYYFKPTKDKPRYWVITEKKGSLWHREAFYLPERSLAMEAWYKDSEGKIPHGDEARYSTSKRLSSFRSYNNGVKHGAWLSYDEDGKLRDSTNYQNGYLSGISLSWYSGGTLSDSSNFDGKGNGTSFEFFPNGQILSEGRWKQDTNRIGKWKYYYESGTLSREEDYHEGELSKRTCYNLDGSAMDSSLCVEVEAEFPGGNEKWRKFLQKNLNANVPVKKKAPPGSYTVVIQFIVDKEGNLIDYKPVTNFGYGMEDEVIRMMKRSPKWRPAFQFGRNVKAYKRQPVTFIVSEY